MDDSVQVITIKNNACPFCKRNLGITHIQMSEYRRVKGLKCLKCKRIYLDKNNYKDLDKYVKSIGDRLNSCIYCYTIAYTEKPKQTKIKKIPRKKQPKKQKKYILYDSKSQKKQVLSKRAQSKYKGIVIGIQRKSCEYFYESHCKLLEGDCNIARKQCIYNAPKVIPEVTSNLPLVSEELKEPEQRKVQHRIKRDISKIGVTVIVLCDNRKCTENEHKIEDLMALIRIVTPKGEILEKEIPAAYCYDCDKYFVLKMDYENLCKIGVPLCPVEDRTRTIINKTSQSFTSGSESELHRRGYNVRKASNFTDEQRITILADILENTPVTRHEIVSNLSKNIRQHKNQGNYSDATRQWERDLIAIQGYKTGDIPEVLINKVIIGKR